MKFKRFIYSVLFITLSFVFANIYQYNRFVRYSYSKQRLEAKRDSLIKNKDSLLVDLFKTKNQANIIQYAKTELGFRTVESSSVFTLSSQDVP